MVGIKGQLGGVDEKSKWKDGGHHRIGNVGSQGGIETVGIRSGLKEWCLE